MPPTPDAAPTHPGLVRGPGQGPRLLGPLPDTLTEGAGWGRGAGALRGPDPKHPIFSDSPHAHPAIQALFSGQLGCLPWTGFSQAAPWALHRGSSVPDDAGVALAWQRPPGGLGGWERRTGPEPAWLQAACRCYTSGSGHWGGPVCSLHGSEGCRPPPGACGSPPRLSECRGPFPLLGQLCRQLHPHRPADQWRRGSWNWVQIPPYSEPGLWSGFQ